MEQSNTKNNSKRLKEINMDQKADQGKLEKLLNNTNGSEQDT